LRDSCWKYKCFKHHTHTHFRAWNNVKVIVFWKRSCWFLFFLLFEYSPFNSVKLGLNYFYSWLLKDFQLSVTATYIGEKVLWLYYHCFTCYFHRDRVAKWKISLLGWCCKHRGTETQCRSKTQLLSIYYNILTSNLVSRILLVITLIGIVKKFCVIGRMTGYLSNNYDENMFTGTIKILNDIFY